ncbi:hypothetical protein BDR07DRAFT_1383735 [Suillus spraguei]|nr:hypothetical protein BDR07DRAFT_1383735 [Suillus spraguei]
MSLFDLGSDLCPEAVALVDVQSRYFGKRKAKSAAKTPPTAGNSSSGKAGSEVTTGGPPEAAIELTEGEEMDMGEVARQVAEDSDVEDEVEFQWQLDELRDKPLPKLSASLVRTRVFDPKGGCLFSMVKSESNLFAKQASESARAMSSGGLSGSGKVASGAKKQ